jgi:hypothetical protein
VFVTTRHIPLTQGRFAFTHNFTGIYADRNWLVVPRADNVSHIDEDAIPYIEGVARPLHTVAEVLLTDSAEFEALRFVEAYRFRNKDARRKYEEPDWPALIAEAREEMNRADFQETARREEEDERRWEIMYRRADARRRQRLNTGLPSRISDEAQRRFDWFMQMAPDFDNGPDDHPYFIPSDFIDDPDDPE